jgi:hypothetical protein
MAEAANDLAHDSQNTFVARRIDHEFSAAEIEEARLIITSHGYDCQVVDYMRTYIAGGGWIVVCNGYRYRFNIEDRGGRWWVEAIAQ